MATRVVVVEDDARLGRLLAEFLESQGFEVVVEGRGDAAVALLVDTQPDVAILDLMLPGIDGFEVFRRVRSRFRGRVIMLTARRADADQVAGLELGADDYVTKPVDPRVLVARIQAVLRRGAPEEQPRTLLLGDLSLEHALREARVGGVPVDLTGAEFDLLWLLARNEGHVVPRDVLYREVRGTGYDGLDRTIDIHVSRLRKKLRDAGLAGDVKSVRSIGYQLAVRA